MATDLAQTPSAEQRYRLPDIVLAGKPVSTNRYKHKFRIPGSHRVMSDYTPEATAWKGEATWQAQRAVRTAHADGLPPVVEWPRPLRFSVYVRDGHIDLDNALKVPVDGIRDGLGVDDRQFEYGCVVREAYGGRSGVPRGLRIVVESAPLAETVAAGSSTQSLHSLQPLETTKPAPRARATRRQVVRATPAHPQRVPVASSRAPRQTRRVNAV